MSQQIVKNIEINYPGFGKIRLAEGYAVHKSWYQTAEKQTKQWWCNNIKSDWNILDIGANVGMYSALFSKLATKGKIFCFEPTPTIKILEKNLNNLNAKNCVIYDVAVGDKTGIIQEKLQMIWKRKVLEKQFTFTTIDQFCGTIGEKINAIKIDIDGFDPEALYGAQKILKEQSPVVIVELNPTALSYRGHTPRQAVEFMKSQNYPLLKVMDGENYLFRKNQ